MTNIDRIAESARRNPEGLLLLAAGVALLLRKSSTSRSRPGQSRSYAGFDLEGEGLSQATRGVGDYAAKVKDRVADAASGVAETASDYASSAQDYVERTGHRLADRSGDYARRAQTTVQENIDRIVQDQPLAIAFAGLAAGAAVAAVFPATRMERDTLGQYGEQLSEAATTARRKAGEAATAAGGELKRVAREKGLDADGLQDVAKEVGEAIEGALEGTAASSMTTPVSPGMPNQTGSAGRPRAGKTSF
jgi:hypothetical protein